MNAGTEPLHPTPRPRDVAREQVRAVGLSLRRFALGGAGLAVLATVIVVGEYVTGGGPVDFAPELSMVPGMLGLLLPLVVWHREERFGAGFLWTLPVDRRGHALAKVLGGWVWLMAAVALFLLWLLTLALVTGGSLLAERTVQLLPSMSVPAPRTLEPSALRSVRWSPSPVLWLTPFTGATAAYLVASAVALGVRHPLRWLAGVVLTIFAVSEIGLLSGSRPLALGPSSVLESVIAGRYGFDALLTARAESFHVQVTLTTGQSVPVWRALPDLGDWGTATLLWTGAGLAGLWAAASRHRERRRG